LVPAAEPFGLVVIEAMANGTPVIAFRRGAVPEIVDDGVTGFIVDSVDEAVAAVSWATALDPPEFRYLGLVIRAIDFVDLCRNLQR
jgi:glycosyltransferase involved in cell wall biosynthesis